MGRRNQGIFQPFNKLDLSDIPDEIDLSDIPDDNGDLFDQFNKSWINQPLLGTQASEGIEKRNQATYGTLDEPLIDRALFPGMGRAANLARDYGLSVQHGVAGTMEGLSTPLNLATMGAGIGAAKTAGTALSRPLTWLERGLSAPVSVSGVDKLTDPSLDPYQRFMGLTEFTGGIAGTAAPFAKVPTARPQTRMSIFDHPIPKGKELPSSWEGYGPKPADPAMRDLPLYTPEGQPPLPASFGPEAFAGPERRQTGERNPVTDTIFQAYRDRLARGEDVRSPQSRELFKKQQDTNQFREAAEETYTQVEDEVGDIVVDKQGNEHQFMGMSPNGKQIWKLTGKRDPEVGATPDEVVTEMGQTPDQIRAEFVPQLTALKKQFGIDSPQYREASIAFNKLIKESESTAATPPVVPKVGDPFSRQFSEQQAATPVFSSPDQIRQHFGERLAEVRTRHGANSPQYGKLEMEFKAALKNAENSQGDLFGPSRMSDVPPDRFTIDPESMGVVDELGPNASGESAASAEAISRNRGMAARGEKFVVYDKAGNRREIIGPEAVDFYPAQGETYGIEYNDGRFSPLTHRGGKVPGQNLKTSLRDTLASIKKFGKSDEGSFKYGDEEGPRIKRLVDWIEGKKSTPEPTGTDLALPGRGRGFDRYEEAKRNLDIRQSRGEVVDYVEELDNLNEQYGVIESTSREADTITKGHQEVLNAGYYLSPKTRAIGKDDIVVGESHGYHIMDSPGHQRFRQERGMPDKYAKQLNESYKMTGPKRHPTATRWQAIVDELAARNAPDSEYRDILSTSTKNALKRGETWRSRVEAGIKYYDDLQKRIDLESDGPSRMSKFGDDDDISRGIDYAELEYNIRQGDLTEPWHPKPNDPPEIAAKRKELSDLEFEQAVLIEQETKGSEGSVLPFEKANRFDQLYDEITQYDKNFEYDLPLNAKGKTEGTIGMGMTPDPIQMMKSYLNTYSEAGGRVATKELVQNAIDAAEDTGGEVFVKLDHAGKHVTVRDTGPGITRHMIENEYTNLTESGKRGGPTKKIGEMGVGKTTYLLGSENFQVQTRVREADGKIWIHEFSGNPEDMYNGTVKVDSKIANMQNGGTGTTVIIGMKDKRQVAASHQFLKQFSKYSNTPVKVNIESLEYPSFYDRKTGKPTPGYEANHDYANIVSTMNPRTFGGGKLIHAGTVTGGDYRLSIPPGTDFVETKQIALILMNRGMFQGIDSVYVDKGELPTAILVEIDPTVDAISTEYPLTAPTRERLKDTFKQPLEAIINKELVEKAAAARKQRLQDAYDSLVPLPWGGHSTLDSGNRYTPAELDAFNNSPHITAIADTFQNVLAELDGLFPRGSSGGQIGRTAKYGFQLTDSNYGGINIPNPGVPYGSVREFAVLINPFSALEGRTPQQAARKMFHIMKHEFTHNIARNEGAGFTWALSETDAKFPIQSEIDAYNKILQALTDQTGGYAPEVQNLLQQHLTARRRPDTTPDLLSEARASEFAKGPGPTGIPGSTGPNGAGVQASNIKPTGGRTTPPIAPPQIQQSLAQLYQLQNIHKMIPPGPIKQSWYGKIRDFNKTLLTSLDVSGAGRQGLPLIAEPEYWHSMEAMWNSLGSQAYYDNLKTMVEQSPWAQKRYAPVVNKSGNRVISPITQTVKLKEIKSFYDEWGLDLSQKEETQGSRYAEMIPGVKASNRAFSGFLTKLRFDTFNRMAQDLLNTGVDIRKDIAVGKQLAEFVNNSTGRGSLGKIEWMAPALNEAFFAPRLMAAKVRRYAQVFNPHTYTTMNPMVRKAAFKSLISTAAFGLAAGQLARVFGAEVNPDPTNSDFGKIRIGNTRIDPFGGDQQYLVAAARMLSGRYTSPENPRYPQQAGDVQEYFKNMGTTGGRFARNKFSPFLGFVTTMFTGKDAIGRKFDPVNTHIPEMIFPLVLQDITEIIKEDPNMFPLGILPVLGIGTQSFGKARP